MFISSDLHLLTHWHAALSLSFFFFCVPPIECVQKKKFYNQNPKNGIVPLWYKVIFSFHWQDANVQSYLYYNILAASGEHGSVSSGLWLCSQSKATPLSETTEMLARTCSLIHRTVKMLTGLAQCPAWEGELFIWVIGGPSPLWCPSEEKMWCSHMPYM